jgi:hypothetical protein
VPSSTSAHGIAVKRKTSEPMHPKNPHNVFARFPVQTANDPSRSELHACEADRTQVALCYAAAAVLQAADHVQPAKHHHPARQNAVLLQAASHEHIRCMYYMHLICISNGCYRPLHSWKKKSCFQGRFMQSASADMQARCQPKLRKEHNSRQSIE